jgi:hypothetical protein
MKILLLICTLISTSVFAEYRISDSDYVKHQEKIERLERVEADATRLAYDHKILLEDYNKLVVKYNKLLASYNEVR